MAAAKGATVALLNAVPLKKFPLLLKRIIERLGASTRDAFFDDAEERQLAGLLGVAPKDLRSICELCAYQFERAARAGRAAKPAPGAVRAGRARASSTRRERGRSSKKNDHRRPRRGRRGRGASVGVARRYSIEKPDALERRLVDDVGVDAAHAAATKAVWAAEAAAYVGALRERHIVGPRVLKDSSWELHLTMAESGGGVSRKDPTAIFELDLAPHDAPSGDGARDAPGAEVLSVECSHAELYDLFGTLQDIQAAIDQLN